MNVFWRYVVASLRYFWSYAKFLWARNSWGERRIYWLFPIALASVFIFFIFVFPMYIEYQEYKGKQQCESLNKTKCIKAWMPANLTEGPKTVRVVE